MHNSFFQSLYLVTITKSVSNVDMVFVIWLYLTMIL